MSQIDEIQKQIQAGTLRLDLDNVHVLRVAKIGWSWSIPAG